MSTTMIETPDLTTFPDVCSLCGTDMLRRTMDGVQFRFCPHCDVACGVGKPCQLCWNNPRSETTQ